MSKNADRGTRAAKLGGLGALLLAALVAGCAPDYVTDSAASVNLLIASINGGAQLDSDVRNGAESTFVCEDEVDVSVAVRHKNPAAPVPSVPNTVLLKSYEVRYFRTDGRGTEGVDVPYRITGNLAVAVDVNLGGIEGGSVTFPLEVVRRQAKVEPPLSSIYQTALLTVMAEVTLYGETVSGQQVSASGRMQIDFADYGDDEETCPASD